MPARVRLLVSGDLHLGRYPSRVPPDDPALSIESVVRALVDQAIERAVDAVVLVGDLADEANKHFEAFGVLERALHRLSDAGVAVYAVAGDHDHDVLGQVIDAVDSPLVHLLGRGETWETMTLEKRGEPVLHLAGWSFAGPHVHASPLEDGPDLEADDLPTIGILHGTIGGTGAHAPVTLDALWETDATAWLVASGHSPRIERKGDRLVIVPGSPQPLGPSEAGVHNAWLVELGQGATRATPVPLATVRYDALAVDLEGAADAGEVRERINDALRAYAHDIHEASPSVRRSVVRLTLTGDTNAYRAIE
ncbi:metallophosphoesterase family protein, partial [Rubrivirga sp.]|uniref:metallophosphoesterase family protein n=1 Tax=Rubrivirga sp. TaxID=1885344 RepID=UPI003C758561